MIVSNDKTLKLPPIDHRPQTHLNDISNLQKIFKRTLKDPVSRIQTTFNWTKIKPRFLETKKVPIVDETSKLKEALYNWMQSDNDPNILLNKQTVEYAVLSCLRESNSTLKIQNLEYLSELPDFIFNIPIRELEIYNCNQLTTIPLSSFQLKNLQRLSIRGCSNFEKIPIEIENLSNLLNL